MAVILSALDSDRCFTPQKHYFYASGTHFCYDLVRLEGFGKLIKIAHLIGSRTRNLLACSIAP
jgi:hypothetical protein